MKSVFLDFATISRGDIDAESLDRVLPDLQYFPTTDDAELHQRVGAHEVALLQGLGQQAVPAEFTGTWSLQQAVAQSVQSVTSRPPSPN